MSEPSTTLTSTGHNPELLETFEEMCRIKEWTKHEVLEYLMEYAIREGNKLAYPLHRWRVIRHYKGELWHKPDDFGSDF
jgi:hypothetical protein